MKAGLALGCLCARVFFSGFSWVALVLVLESERASERASEEIPWAKPVLFLLVSYELGGWLGG